MNKIRIKPENRGKFTATKKRTGKTTEELTHSKNPLTRKRAIFAKNAKKWKHQDGSFVDNFIDSFKLKDLRYTAKDPLMKIAQQKIISNIDNTLSDYSFGGGQTSGSGAGGNWNGIPFVKENTEDNILYIPTPVQRSFTEAFAEARKQGLKTFNFNGKTYTTEVSENPHYTTKEYETIPASLRLVSDNKGNIYTDSTKVVPTPVIYGQYKRSKDPNNQIFKQSGGIVTPYGQWEYPGEVTIIPSNEITMKGIDYDVLGVSDTGDVKLMTRGNDYKFDGNYVTEYPLKAQQGIHYDFVSKYLPMIQNELSNYSDVNDSIAKNLLYQMAQESQYGTRTPNPTNFWGIKDPGKETYRNFGTLENGLKYWIQQIHDNYPDAWEANDTIEYANGLTTGRNNMRYMSASPDSYMQNMKTLEKQYNLFLQNTSNNITAKDQSGTFINMRDKDNRDISKYGKVIEEENLRDVFDIPVTQYSRFEDGTRMQVVYGNNNVNDTIVGNYITTPKYINKDTLDLKDRFATYDNNGNPIWHKKLEGSFVPIPTVGNKMADYSGAVTNGFLEGDRIANIVGTSLQAASDLAIGLGDYLKNKKQNKTQTDSSTDNNSTTAESKQQGGKSSTQAIIEGGEIVEYPDGTMLLDTGKKHEYSGDKIYRPDGKIDGDWVNFTGIPAIDASLNPNLVVIKKGDNPMRKGEPFIYPSTVNQNGYINTKVGNYFPEAHAENIDKIQNEIILDKYATGYQEGGPVISENDILDLFGIPRKTKKK